MLPSVRAAIAATLKKQIEGPLVKVYEHGGRFDEGELKRWAVKAPCVLVAPLRVDGVEVQAGIRMVSAHWGAFAVAKDIPTPKTARDVVAMALVSELLRVIPGNTFGHDRVRAPVDVRAENLYMGKLDGRGTAIWAVTWQQAIEIVHTRTTDLEPFLTFNADYDLEPQDNVVDATDTVTLPQAS